MRKYLFASSCFFCRNRRRGASVAFLFAFASLLFVTLYSAISGHTLSDSYTLIRYMEEKTYSPMQTVKRGFFAMRNGVIADTLRKGGSPFRIIFGLNLPQIVDIAAQTGTNPSLAEDLWHNTTTRESMLLAPMLVAPDAFSKADALRWIADIPTAEVADVLCHRLLRHLPFAWELAEELCDADAFLTKAAGLFRLHGTATGLQSRGVQPLARRCHCRPLSRTSAGAFARRRGCLLQPIAPRMCCIYNYITSEVPI